MFSSISTWSRSKRIKAGLWCSPLIAWSLYGAQWVLSEWLDPLLVSYQRRSNPSDWIIFALVVSYLAFWMVCAAFSGLCAAFFWRNVPMNSEDEASLTLRSVAITWAPTIIICCTWVVLWIPYLAYLAMFRFAVNRGIKFWNSNRPRQWIGDFSDMNSPEE